MDKVEINITPMSLKNGVMGLPIQYCRHWNASKSVDGILKYAGRESHITFSPKHINKENNTAAAWQFTVNDSVQFYQLRMDGIHTYVEETLNGEKLICSLTESNGIYILAVEEVINKPETKATRKLRVLLKQGFREEKKEISKAPVWNSPSEWIAFDKIAEYSDVQDCLYIWAGKKDNLPTIYLYVGIVGDTRKEGRSKRNLMQRLKEEAKKFTTEYGVSIQQFRYCSLNNAYDYLKVSQIAVL